VKIKPFVAISLILILLISFLVVRNMRSGEIPVLPEMSTLEGQTFDPATLKNKVYILSYFQTWCGDCVKEQPQLQQLKQHFGDNLEILMVSDEPVEKLQQFKAKFDAGLTIYHTKKSLKGDLGVRAFPTTYLFSKDGKVLVKKVEGINWYNSEIIDMINGSLKKFN
jgi:thiol-disulfide isomerase/thioredoxin